MAQEFYKVLGVAKTATTDEIKTAFKKLARKHHPDVNPGDKKAEEKFKEISEAYDVLSDPKKRKEYDTMGSFNFEGFPGGGGGRNYQYSSGGSPFGGGAQGFDINDLGDMFGDLFGGQAQKGRGRRGPGFGGGYAATPKKGKDLIFSVNIEFMEAVHGAEKNIRLSNGVSLKVKIPAGVDNGSRIRLSGKGEPGINGGEAGDLFIETKVSEHPTFKRSGDDVSLNLPITILEALKGGKVKVPTLDDAVSLTIPAGSQSGQKMRLKGKGIASMKTKIPGDLYVLLEITVPKSLDKKDMELLETIFSKQEDPRLQMKL